MGDGAGRASQTSARPPNLGPADFTLSHQPGVQQTGLSGGKPGSPVLLRGSSAPGSPCRGADQPCLSQVSVTLQLSYDSFPTAPDELLQIKHLPSSYNIKKIWEKMR